MTAEQLERAKDLENRIQDLRNLRSYLLTNSGLFQVRVAFKVYGIESHSPQSLDSYPDLPKSMDSNDLNEIAKSIDLRISELEKMFIEL